MHPLSTLPTGLAIAAGLFGAARLARGKADGLAAMETTPAGAARSFWAAALCLPAFIALRMTSADNPLANERILFVELTGYALGWIVFPLFARHLARFSGRESLWPRYIATWNWCNVIQYALVLAMSLPIALGAPEPAQTMIAIMLLGYGLWLNWFAARTALAIDARAAMGFVLLDVAVSLAIARVVVTLGEG